MMKNFHPLAELFPLLNGNDFKQLVESIASIGLLEPIILFEDKILDGRNRERACKEAIVAPKYGEFTGANPMAFVAAKNLHRRHLDESQRAVIGEKMATMSKGGYDRDHKPRSRLMPDDTTLEQAADMMKVGKATIQKVRYVRKNGISELAKAMDDHKISVNAAGIIAHFPKSEQLQALTDKLNGKRIVVVKKKNVGKSAIESQREAMDQISNFNGLDPQQVDPELADKPFQFASRYGFVNLHTKEEIESDKDKAAFSEWLGAVKELKRPIKELLKIGAFGVSNVANWIKKTTDPAKYAVRYAEIEEMVNLIKQAGESVIGIAEWLPTQKAELV